MSFLFGNTPQAERKPQTRVEVQPLRRSEPQSEVDRFYGDLVARRPALLEEKLYGLDDELESNAIPVHVHHLRRRMMKAGATAQIHTVRGVGYLLTESKA